MQNITQTKVKEIWKMYIKKPEWLQVNDFSINFRNFHNYIPFSRKFVSPKNAKSKNFQSVTRCRLFSLVVTCFHWLSLVVTRCRLFSFVVTCRHSLSVLFTLLVTRCRHVTLLTCVLQRRI